MSFYRDCRHWELDLPGRYVLSRYCPGAPCKLVGPHPHPLTLLRVRKTPAFVDRPASHAVAHANGDPCPCYPETRRD